MNESGAEHACFMRVALQLARRGYGRTSPNPMVGAVLVRDGEIIGRGWHRRAGEPHAEIEAFEDARQRGAELRGATLYVTLEPCSTHGRTPPCTEAIFSAGVRHVVVGAIDPNPKHAGHGLKILRGHGIELTQGILADEAVRLNEAFNHWVVERTPFVTVKTAMSLDGKIATRTGESKWITGEAARAHGMKLRYGADAMLVGINTVLRDDPSLTVRLKGVTKPLRRIILDSRARTPLASRVISDEHASLTTVVVGKNAPAGRILKLERRVRVWQAPERNDGIDVRWTLEKLGGENVTHLLVEGGGEVNAAFLLGGFAQRIAFFYAPLVIGGNDATKAVAGIGILDAAKGLRLTDVNWKRLGVDLLLTARVEGRRN
ncbi:MAG: bifunctional diaminohydroxyphosphoribosylaminopyrimidine deaminase/5-amino-6-(5-phosphoribosylamino)uracil reductase RibD [Verrucomicrobia subdivision 3 bacterium]|nr:bifunctional diaminohydroxyphosphoribosylaminopyrimidine deaminase/5-amino-6-(5-phosphoribosylamino)uracil reductase RibD [Limisphaerales bacterium]